MSLSVEPKDLSSMNTLGLVSHASACVAFTDEAQLPELTRLASAYDHALVLGGGSNVVLAPQLSGLVICTQTQGIALIADTPDAWLVEAQAGETWHNFVDKCLAKGWAGLENLALIPGTVGAAPVQNIGAYGVELDTRIDQVHAWDIQQGKRRVFSRDECEFAYRDSFFKRQPAGRWLITRVRFRLPKPWVPQLSYPDLSACREMAAAGRLTPRQVFDAVCAIRQSKLPDPAVLGNAGSFFKNPVVDASVWEGLKAGFPDLVGYPQPDGTFKLAAGWLIDRAGWKGRRQGAVGVHDRQALVLVNFGAATSAELLTLAQSICADVYARFGVRLEQEPVLCA